LIRLFLIRWFSVVVFQGEKGLFSFSGTYNYVLMYIQTILKSLENYPKVLKKLWVIG